MTEHYDYDVQAWVRLGLREHEPIPPVWPVRVGYGWLRAPRQYWHEVAETILSLNHALKRVYAPLICQILDSESRLYDLFTEAADTLPESKWTGRTFHLDFAT